MFNFSVVVSAFSLVVCSLMLFLEPWMIENGMGEVYVLG